MRQVREILRFHHEKGLSRERIAGALGISKGAVHNTLNRFAQSGLPWPLPADLGDSGLEARLFPQKAALAAAHQEILPDMVHIEAELRRKHVTVELLYREYRERQPEGMKRSAFYRYIRAHLPKPVNMKMIHKGGDKLFVDFSGDGVEYIDRETGEIKEARIFVASWGASSYTYVGARASENAENFVLAHEEAFRFFGCAPHALVPDNTKSAVRKPDRYEPEPHALYAALASHYNTVILPARIRAPQDKAVAETNVGFGQRFILARLRNERFFSVHQINAAIGPLLVELNNQPMQGYGGQTRKERFELLDKPYAQALAVEPFRIRATKLNATIAPNYHVRFEDHFYSVPHHLARQKVDIYLDGNIVEIYHDHLSVARHKKQPPNFGYSTIPEHMPPNHRYVRGWSPEWFIQKAGQIGPKTAEAVQMIMERRRHAQQGFNSALGVLNLAKKYTPQRLEAAATRALHYRGVSYRSLCAILEQKLDLQDLQQRIEAHPFAAVDHENVRGPGYYHQTSLFGAVPEHGPA